VRGIVRLSRLEHGLLAGFIVVASYVVGGGRDPLGALLLYLSTLLAEVFLFVSNDMRNIEEDKINRPNAPLVTGEVSLSTARSLAYSSLVLSLALALIGVILGSINYRCLPILLIALTLGYTYNAILKRLLIINNITVALVSSLTFIYGLYASGNVLTPLPHLFFIASLLSTMGRELVKGIIDVKGDSAVGVRTVANTMGVSYAIKLAVVFTLASVASSIPIVLLTLGDGFIVTIGVLVTDSLLVLLSLRLLTRGEAYAEAFRANSLGSMAIAIVSYLVYSLFRVI